MPWESNCLWNSYKKNLKAEVVIYGEMEVKQKHQFHEMLIYLDVSIC